MEAPADIDFQHWLLCHGSKIMSIYFIQLIQLLIYLTKKSENHIISHNRFSSRHCPGGFLLSVDRAPHSSDLIGFETQRPESAGAWSLRSAEHRGYAQVNFLETKALFSTAFFILFATATGAWRIATYL